MSHIAFPSLHVHLGIINLLTDELEKRWPPIVVWFQHLSLKLAKVTQIRNLNKNEQAHLYFVLSYERICMTYIRVLHVYLHYVPEILCSHTKLVLIELLTYNYLNLALGLSLPRL